MATELGLLSLTHLHKLAQSQDNQNQNQIQNQDLYQLNPNTLTTTSTFTTGTTITTPNWMWNPKAQHHHQEAEEDSWEVRAFAEDTGNVMGTTWPPRSYTCAFCRREFRSAQALGGHMNVHRRDRARLHQVMPPPNSIINHTAPAVASASSSSATSSFLIPAPEFVSANGSSGGLCLVYQLPNPNYNAGATNLNACTDHQSPSPSTLLSISPYPPGNLAAGRPRSLGVGSGTSNYINAHHHHRAEEPSDQSGHDENGDEEELDLELRLGHGPTTS